MIDLKGNNDKLLKFVAEKYESNQLDNNSLVQLIELAGNYLNLSTVADYAKDNQMSYNGVKKSRKKIKIFNVNFVIENE